ncbi:uncharacterized protein LOC132707055 isoform X2 [Cylas formicarius]|nr:uncharacterized protein LOC132707055 isoform X2 [Cylas formicarius]XP_060534684.1 uncharacterized protein LOC132707055 isoform X2 [Cylas formicarius]
MLLLGHFLVAVAIFEASGDPQPISKELDDERDWIEINYRPVRFSQSIYKAQVLKNNSIDVVDGPILLDNPPEGVYFVVTSDNYVDYVLTISPNDTKDPTREMSVTMEVSGDASMQRDLDVVILEALDDNLTPLARTTILVVDGDEYDPYKLMLKTDNRKYIVLDRFYFQLFLLLLIVTGVLLWLVEMHDIVRHLRARRQRKQVSYKILTDA